jgi:endonuclease YncB( thermonuclease family)
MDESNSAQEQNDKIRLAIPLIDFPTNAVTNMPKKTILPFPGEKVSLAAIATRRLAAMHNNAQTNEIGLEARPFLRQICSKLHTISTRLARHRTWGICV